MTWEINIHELPPSLNEFYAGTHWTKRRAYTKYFHGTFLRAFEIAQLPKELPYPLDVEVTSYCQKRIRDCDNTILATKFVLDSLVEGGYISNDNPTFVKSTKQFSIKSPVAGVKVVLIYDPQRSDAATTTSDNNPYRAFKNGGGKRRAQRVL